MVKWNKHFVKKLIAFDSTNKSLGKSNIMSEHRTTHTSIFFIPPESNIDRTV
jgi:hypothetical protein